MTDTSSIQCDLAGQVAFVTGAGRGIRRAIAHAYAAAGASVVLAARTEAQIVQVAEEIDAAGGNALPIAVDVTDLSALTTAVDTAVSQLQRPRRCRDQLDVHGAR